MESSVFHFEARDVACSLLLPPTQLCTALPLAQLHSHNSTVHAHCFLFKPAPSQASAIQHTNSSTGQHTLIFQLTTIDYNSSCASTWIDYFHFWDLELHYHFRFPLTAPSLWWPLVSPLPRCPKSASSLGETAKSRRVVQPLGHM
jgi:hypothetical protein